MVVLGDFNAHFSFLTSANARVETKFDRDLLAWLSDPLTFNCRIHNPQGVPTHISGTAIDVVAGPKLWQVAVRVIEAGVLFRSDHAVLFCDLPGTTELFCKQNVGGSCWDPSCDWSGFVELADKALKFITGFAATAMREPLLRQWVELGRRRGTRQALLDRAVWYRAVVFDLAGHFSGFALTRPPRGTGRRISDAGFASKGPRRVRF